MTPGVQVAPQQMQILRARVDDLMPAVLSDLESLVKIPSVSAAAFDQTQVQASADAVARLCRDAGFASVEVLRAQMADGRSGAPAVVAHRPGPAGSPTVLLYAHHDVQPPGDPALWDTPAFEPTRREGRLFGRGAADDKAGVMLHLGSLRALGEDLNVGVTLFCEGEEEVGSPSFTAFLEQYTAQLAADVIIVADSSNWTTSVPALTTSLRGLVEAEVEVSTLDHAVHSGMYGGAVPDATTALLRLLSGLWDANGAVAVPGLGGTPNSSASTPDYPESAFRQDAGVLESVGLIGAGDLTARLWTLPSITVTGIDVPSVANASNTLLPAVRAKLSLRVPPGEDPEQAYAALAAHLQACAPWGARVQVKCNEIGQPWAGQVDGPVYGLARWALQEAWEGTAPVDMGVGGSIPFIADLGQVFPDATVLVTGVEDPDTRAHGTNESLHLESFQRAVLAQTLLLAAMGSTGS